MIGRRDFFFRAHVASFHTHASLLTIVVCFFVLFRSCCSNARMFRKTLVHQFHISYSHTDWYLPLFANPNGPILNGTFLFSFREICLGRSFVYKRQIKLNYLVYLVTGVISFVMHVLKTFHCYGYARRTC